MADWLEGGGPVPHSDWPDWWPEPYRIAHPYWHVWEGVAGLKYARRLLSSPPRVVRTAGSADDLKAAIDESEAQRTGRQMEGTRRLTVIAE